MHHDTTASGGYINATRVTGTTVYDPKGEKLGRIEDVVLTRVDGQAVFAVLSFGGFLGIGEDHYPLPWSMLRYDTSLDGYVVDITREQLDGAPSYRADTGADWSDPAFGTRVSDHYRRPVVDPAEGEILR